MFMKKNLINSRNLNFRLLFFTQNYRPVTSCKIGSFSETGSFSRDSKNGFGFENVGRCGTCAFRTKQKSYAWELVQVCKESDASPNFSHICGFYYGLAWKYFGCFPWVECICLKLFSYADSTKWFPYKFTT